MWHNVSLNLVFISSCVAGENVVNVESDRKVNLKCSQKILHVINYFYRQNLLRIYHLKISGKYVLVTMEQEFGSLNDIFPKINGPQAKLFHFGSKCLNTTDEQFLRYHVDKETRTEKYQYQEITELNSAPEGAQSCESDICGYVIRTQIVLLTNGGWVQ